MRQDVYGERAEMYSFNMFSVCAVSAPLEGLILRLLSTSAPVPWLKCANTSTGADVVAGLQML